MSDTNEKGRPGQENGLSRNTNTDSHIVIDAADVPAYLDAGFVCLVATTDVVKGSTRRRVYFNLPSATAAVHRAESRGNRARIILAKLVPVGEAR